MNENRTAKVPHVRKPERVGFFRRLFHSSNELSGVQWELQCAKGYADGLRERAKRSEELAKHLETLLKKLQEERNVSWPKPSTRLSDKQVMQEFDLPVDTGVLAALHQELDDELQELLDRVSQPPSSTLTEATRLHIAGGVEHLRLFQRHLIDLSARASTSDPDLQEDKKETKK